MKIDLHVHTNHSFDCGARVEQVIQAAEKVGLNAIAITDHDTLSGIEVARKQTESLTIIPGMEVSTWKGIHLLGLFITEEIQSRDLNEIIDEIHDQGGLVVLPHPFRHSSGLIYGKEKHGLFTGEDLREIFRRIDLVEVVNFGCTAEENQEANNYFDTYPNIPQAAGSDAHESQNVGKAFIDLIDFESDNLEEIKEALLKRERLIRYEVYDMYGSVPRVKRLAQDKPGILDGIKDSFKKIMARLNRREDSGDSG
jgi:predicted metal-dependent phosphoesterase TrpH